MKVTPAMYNPTLARCFKLSSAAYARSFALRQATICERRVASPFRSMRLELYLQTIRAKSGRFFGRLFLGSTNERI